LARVSQSEEGEVAELLAFSCNDEPYAVTLCSVHEIVIPPPITLVPRSPYPVLGVCSVRGELATIVDLRRVLGLPPAEDAARFRILLARLRSSELVGLRVDEVKQVVRLLPSQIEYSSQTLGGDVYEGVRGIGRPTVDEVIVILDLVAVLAKGYT
jgi:purine-binding chemotaxis protein CheW